jgi:hypothetical protein
MRNPARKGKADSNHKAIAEAIAVLGFPVMDLHAAGNGVEDLLVGIKRPIGPGGISRYDWLLVECKVARNKRAEITPSQYTKEQKEWREETAWWPRITATSAQDAVDQIRALTR